MSTGTASSENIWSIDVPQPSGDYTPCPAGNYPGRICGLFDIGHHPEEKTDDRTKVKSMVDTHKLVLVFELAEKQPNGKPHTIALKLTWSMHEKSTFFKLVTGITGVKLQPNTTFNPKSILGMAVLVNVVQKPGRDNKVHANVETVSQWMRGLSEPTWTYAPLAWSVREVGKPFPEMAWLPLVYGKTIKTLAGESCEARGFSPGSTPAVPSAATIGNGPVMRETVIRSNVSEYPADLQPLLARYGLPAGYTVDELAEAVKTHGIGDDEFGRLHGAAVPF